MNKRSRGRGGRGRNYIQEKRRDSQMSRWRRGEAVRQASAGVLGTWAQPWFNDEWESSNSNVETRRFLTRICASCWEHSFLLLQIRNFLKAVEIRLLQCSDVFYNWRLRYWHICWDSLTTSASAARGYMTMPLHRGYGVTSHILQS